MADTQKELPTTPGPLRLKVKTNGTLDGTVVTDQEGRRLTINAITLPVDSRHPVPTIILEIPNVEVEYVTRKV